MEENNAQNEQTRTRTRPRALTDVSAVRAVVAETAMSHDAVTGELVVTVRTPASEEHDDDVDAQLHAEDADAQGPVTRRSRARSRSRTAPQVQAIRDAGEVDGIGLLELPSGAKFPQRRSRSPSVVSVPTFSPGSEPNTPQRHVTATPFSVEGDADAETQAADTRHLAESVPHTLPAVDVARALETSLVSGLARVEAARRLTVYGKNEVPIETRGIFAIMLGQLLNAVTFILMVVFGLMIVSNHLVDAVVVVVVLAFNVGIGFAQEYAAEVAMRSLSLLSASEVDVLRDGKPTTVRVETVTVGDIVLLAAGSVCPADVRLVEASALEIDESMLTGESIPVRKKADSVAAADAALGDRTGMAFGGTTVLGGRGRGIVTAIGLKSEMGAIAQQLSRAPPKARIEVMMKKLMYRCVMWAAVLMTLVFASVEFKIDNIVLSYSTALGVAILPEGIVAVTTVTLAVGVRRMAEQRAIVRKITAIEALGACTDVCSDKTGTLTEGRMTAVSLHVAGAPSLYMDYAAHALVPARRALEEAERARAAAGVEEGEGPHAPKAVAHNDAEAAAASSTPSIVRGSMRDGTTCDTALLCCALCSSTDGIDTNPTERAVRELAEALGYDKDALVERYSRRGAHDFSSAVKLMSAGAHDHRYNQSAVFVKGAPERVLARCDRVVDPENADAQGAAATSLCVSRPLTEDDKEDFTSDIEELAGAGLRTVALAYRSDIDLAAHSASVGAIARDEVEQNLTLIGIVALRDPPKPTSAPAITTSRRAGVCVRMLTGDHPGTAASIAAEVGILNGVPHESEIMTGPQLEAMSDSEIDALPELPLVIARCSPLAKVRLIEALHRRNRLVAMTGDGVNDAPAIRLADVGIAMGVSGTAVTKSVADVVLTDDNFATIVAAVAEGRKIFASIQRVVTMLLAGNVAEMVVLMVGLSFRSPNGDLAFTLSPLQILWLNLATSSPPSIALALDRVRTPIDQLPMSRNLFDARVVRNILLYGIIMGAIALVQFTVVVYGFGGGDIGVDCIDRAVSECSVIRRARATIFVFLNVAFLLLPYVIREPEKPVWRISWTSNGKLLACFLGGTLVLLPSLYIPWVADNIFHQDPIDWEWIVVVIGALVFIATCEISRRLQMARLQK